MCTVECVIRGREWAPASGGRAAPNTHGLLWVQVDLEWLWKVETVSPLLMMEEGE